MSNLTRAIDTAVLCLALASCAIPTQKPSVGVEPGVYKMTVRSETGQPHPYCNTLTGMGDVIFLGDGMAKTGLFGLFQINVDSTGKVSGSGAEALSGYNGWSTLTGKRTDSGYEGTAVSVTHGYDCTEHWTMSRVR